MTGFCLCIFMTIHSCKTEQTSVVCDATNTAALPSDAAARFYFKDSSYWVYRDSVSGQLDSQWVFISETGAKSLTVEDSEDKCFSYANYAVNSKSGILYHFYLSPQGIQNGYNYFELIVQPYNSSHPIAFAAVKGNAYNTIGKTDSRLDSIPALLVNGTVYKDVFIRESTLPALYPDIYTTGYYVRHIGLVKYIRKDGSIWELLRYRIRQ